MVSHFAIKFKIRPFLYKNIGFSLNILLAKEGQSSLMIKHMPLVPDCDFWFNLGKIM